MYDIREEIKKMRAEKERQRQEEREAQLTPEQREKNRQYAASVKDERQEVRLTMDYFLERFRFTACLDPSVMSNTYRQIFEQLYKHLSTPFMQKGLLLYSRPGTGKTTLMRIFNHVTDSSDYELVNCLDVAEDFSKQENGLDRYKKGRFCFDDLGTEEIKTRFGTRCDCLAEIIQYRYNLQDWYKREIFKTYSAFVKIELTPDEENLLQQGWKEEMTPERRQLQDALWQRSSRANLLKERMAELWKNYPITHYTTNLTMAELCERYGERVASRIDETTCKFAMNNEPNHRIGMDTMNQ